MSKLSELLDKKPETFGKKDFQEAISLFNVFSDFQTQQAFSTAWFSDGQFWNVLSNGNSTGGAFWTAYYWLSTYWFNKMQRYLGRYLYISNAYATTAVNNLTILAMGSGFEYTTDNVSKQKRLDDWLHRNGWHERSIEAFKRYLIDGEVFFRLFNEGDDVRFIDPDLIYTNGVNDPKQDQYSGVLFDRDDQETVTGFEVHSDPSGVPGQYETVSADEIQQRANKHWGQRRGFSHVLPVATDLFLADELSVALMRSAKLRGSIGAIREHDAPQSAVSTFRAQIQTQPQNQWNNLATGQNGGPIFPPENLENYPPGSIIDTGVNTKWNVLENVDASSYETLIDVTLRKISSHFHLPMGIFAQDKSERGAYASEMVSNSYLVRSIEAMQDAWKECDKRLLEMAGFDCKDVSITAPDVAMVDKKASIEEAAFLLNMQIASRCTIAKTFNLDYEREKELIASEQEELNKANEDYGTAGNEPNPGNGKPGTETVDALQSQALRSDIKEPKEVPPGDA